MTKLSLACPLLLHLKELVKILPYALIFTSLTIISFSCNTPAFKEQNREQQISDRPNIILFVADDHGKDAIGIYGNPIIKTPNLDRLGKISTRFNRAFCTTASCSASRSVILSGLHNHANGHYGHMHTYHHFSAYDDVVSLPVMLEEAGYRTGHVGKFHIAPESVFQFQHRFKAHSRSVIEMAEACESFIKEKSPDPFFLYFCFSDPHRGGGFAEELPYQPDRFGNRLEGWPGVEEEIYALNDVIVPPFLPDNSETRAEIAQYYQSITRLDKGVGRVLDYLEESGKMDNTFIIYISDNGMAFPGAKTTLYEAGMQLPCIVKLPNQQDERTSNEMVSWTDLAPTILDIAGFLKTEQDFHGISFVPALRGDYLDRSEVYASHTFHEVTMYYPMRVIRGNKYKLIMNLASGLEYPFASDLYASKTWQSVLNNNLDVLGKKPIAEYINRPPFELYDLEIDPNETFNLAMDPKFDEILSGLKGKLLTFQEATNDPWIYKWEYE